MVNEDEGDVGMIDMEANWLRMQEARRSVRKNEVPASLEGEPSVDMVRKTLKRWVWFL